MLEWIFWILGCMWSIGCVGVILYAAGRLLGDGDILAGVLVLCLGGPLAVLLAYAPWAIAADAQSPDLATLKKRDWICSETRLVNSTSVVATGKTTAVVPTTRSECIAYSRTN